MDTEFESEIELCHMVLVEQKQKVCIDKQNT